MKPSRASAALMLTLTLLSGCASAGPTWVFEKSDATAAQLKHDRDECFAASIEAENANRGLGFRINREAYRACMEGRGYRVQVTASASGLDR